MRHSILAVILAALAGACAASDGPAGGPGAGGTLQAELDEASCEELRTVMAEALRNGADRGAEDGSAEGSGRRPAPAASMFIPIPGAGLLSRLFSGGSDESADPETVYRAAHDAYAARGCAPEVPFGES